jgi:hypothetical protein
MSSEKFVSDDEHVDREIGLTTGEIIPRNRLENQIRLATELYKRLKDENIDLHSKETRNEIMFFWSEDGENSYSKTYKDIENDPNFMFHHRLHGNILNITIDDVIFYKENKTLPLD